MNWQRSALLGLLLATVLLAFTDLSFLIRQPELTSRPTEAKAFCRKAAVLLSSGKFGEAMGLYTRAIHLDDTLASAWSGRALTFCKQGYYHQARRDAINGLLRNSGDNPELADMRYVLAVALSGLGRKAEALESLELCLRCVPNHREGQELEKKLRSCEILFRIGPDSGVAPVDIH
jgi:tetratricopeptide (TPR) repeat protein